MELPADGPELLDLALFCVGSPTYRSAQRERAADALSVVPAANIAAFLQNAHLDALFLSIGNSEFSGNPHMAELASLLSPRAAISGLVNGNIMTELANLGTQFAERAPGVRPIVLKGAASWPYYSDIPGARRTRDIDILVNHPSDVDAICDVIEHIGYESLYFEGDDRSARAQLWEFAGFSAPPYRMFRQADLGQFDPQAMRRIIETCDALPDVTWDDDKGVVLTVDIEVHMALMRLETGRLIRHTPAQLAALPSIPELRSLSAGPMLAYTAAKLCVDMIVSLSDPSPNPKCLKLCADFTRILLAISQRDFEDAFAAARRWDCLHHLVAMLRSTRDLVPEVVLPSLPDSQEFGLYELFLSSFSGQVKDVRYG